MNPDDQQEAQRIFEKNLSEGSTLDEAHQKLVEEGFNDEVIQKVISSTPAQPHPHNTTTAPGPHQGDVVIATAEVADITKATHRKWQKSRALGIGIVLGLLFNFFPWYTVNCHSSFYRRELRAFPDACTNLTVSGFPVAINGYATYYQKSVITGQTRLVRTNVGPIGFSTSLGSPLALDYFFWIGLALLAAFLKYRFIDRKRPA